MATRNARIFSDLDLNFNPHPVSGDIVKKYDENAIKQSIKNLMLTQNYERPFHSEVGSQIKSLLFELPTSMTGSLIKRQIMDTITNFEPRANILDVTVLLSPDNNGIYCTIVFTVINSTTPISIDLFLERTR
jgi:phage baseplate assembly protein W